MAQILVVDDEPAIRNKLLRYLTVCGHDVRTAADGQQAMAAIDAAPTDLLITDVNMPNMDGMEILNRIRESGSAVPIIAISGGGVIDSALLLDAASVLGAVLTLEKPFELDALRRAVERALQGIRERTHDIG